MDNTSSNNATVIGNQLGNDTGRTMSAADPLLIQALLFYKRARIGNDLHKYWFAFSCPIGLVSIFILFIYYFIHLFYLFIFFENNFHQSQFNFLPQIKEQVGICAIFPMAQNLKLPYHTELYAVHVRYPHPLSR